MDICRMGKEHIQQVAEIEKMFFSPWSATELTAELNRPNGLSLVGIYSMENTVCGWCCAHFVQDESELLKIAVHSSCQQKGLATALIHHLWNLLEDQSVASQFLEVRAMNQPAIQLYTKLGFRQTGVRKNYYSDPVDDALIFCKNFITH